MFYNVLFVAYALLYMWASEPCDLGLGGERAFLKAYYFSVETMMTIGYGVGGEQKDDPFFNDCAANARSSSRTFFERFISALNTPLHVTAETPDIHCRALCSAFTTIVVGRRASS